MSIILFKSLLTKQFLILSNIQYNPHPGFPLAIAIVANSDELE